jgi:hypothetical protein
MLMSRIEVLKDPWLIVTTAVGGRVTPTLI